MRRQSAVEAMPRRPRCLGICCFSDGRRFCRFRAERAAGMDQVAPSGLPPGATRSRFHLSRHPPIQRNESCVPRLWGTVGSW